MLNPRNPVSDVMSRGAVCVDEKLTLRSLAAVLTELNIGVALVQSPDGAMSVVSERDVVDALAAGEGVRHMAGVDTGEIVGVVSARDVLPILASYARATS